MTILGAPCEGKPDLYRQLEKMATNAIMAKEYDVELLNLLADEWGEDPEDVIRTFLEIIRRRGHRARVQGDLIIVD